MPAYREYGMFLGDIKEGIEWVKNNSEAAFQKLKTAQTTVEALHSPQVIASQWEALFDKILSV
jgi:hypothetical protein